MCDWGLGVSLKGVSFKDTRRDMRKGEVWMCVQQGGKCLAGVSPRSDQCDTLRLCRRRRCMGGISSATIRNTGSTRLRSVASAPAQLRSRKPNREVRSLYSSGLLEVLDDLFHFTNIADAIPEQGATRTREGPFRTIEMPGTVHHVFTLSRLRNRGGGRGRYRGSPYELPMVLMQRSPHVVEDAVEYASARCKEFG